MLFRDVCDQLTAGLVLMDKAELIRLMDEPRSAPAVKVRLTELLSGCWSNLWIKSPPKKKLGVMRPAEILCL
jgi:hypothetical protein